MINHNESKSTGGEWGQVAADPWEGVQHGPAVEWKGLPHTDLTSSTELLQCLHHNSTQHETWPTEGLSNNCSQKSCEMTHFLSVDSRMAECESGMSDRLDLKISPRRVTAPIIYWFASCIEIWELINHATSLLLWVLHKLKGKERVRQIESKILAFALGFHSDGLQFREWYSHCSHGEPCGVPWSLSQEEMGFTSTAYTSLDKQTRIQILRITTLLPWAHTVLLQRLEYWSRNLGKCIGLSREEEKRGSITTRAQIQVALTQQVWHWITDQALLFLLLNRSSYTGTK